MRLRVNGEEREVPEGTTVTALLDLVGVRADRLAVEVNREIVPRSEHGSRVLGEADRVEIVTMVGGG